VTKRILLLVFALGVFATNLTAESIPVIRKTVSEVQLTVVATDNGGRTVPSLSPADIVVLEDGQPIPSFELRSASDLPLRVGIVVDTSDSTQVSWSATRAAVADFLEQLMRPDDEMLLLTFDSKIRLARTATDPRQLQLVMMTGQSGGQTALFDALYSACQHSMFSAAGDLRRSALIVFSDGEDNLSWHDLEDTVQKAEVMGVAVYTITTHDRRFKTRGDSVLHTLADATGGRDFVVSKTQELREALTIISGELRSSYLLYYHSPAESGNRQFRRVRVVAAQHDGPHVRSKAGYFMVPGPANDH
jgi:VWFA-related protein